MIKYKRFDFKSKDGLVPVTIIRLEDTALELQNFWVSGSNPTRVIYDCDVIHRARESTEYNSANTHRCTVYG